MNGAAPIIIVLITSLTTLVISPIVLAVIARRSKKQDWERQDKVAAQAAEAARLLVSSNRQISERLEESNASTEQRLDQIHTLVNSNLTVAMQSETTATASHLTALQRERLLLLEIIALKRSQGLDPSEEAMAALAASGEQISAAQEKLAELRINMRTRHEQTERADEGMPVDAPTERSA